MSKYFTPLPIFGLLMFTGCSTKQSKYSAVPNSKSPSYNYNYGYNYDIKVPTAEYEFSNERLATLIKQLEGKPYIWAEEGPSSFDCSGYLYYMFGKMGVTIPRVAREQIKQGVPVEMSNLKFGDFIFFNTTKVRSDKITHVGIYLKDGWFSHASSSGGKTTYGNLFTNKYYNERFKGARRYAQENSYVAFEPKLSMYAIDKTNQANEVTTYANNNAKPIQTMVANIEKPKPVLVAQKIALAKPTPVIPVAVPKVVTPVAIVAQATIPKIPNPTIIAPVAPVVMIAKAEVEKIVTPATATPVAVMAKAEAEKTTKLALVPLAQDVSTPVKLADATMKPISQLDTTTIEVTNSTQIAYNPEPATSSLDIKVSEIEHKTTKPIEIKVASKKPVTDTKIATTKVVPTAKRDKTGYYVQLGQFQNKPNTELLKKIKSNGYAYTLMPSKENGKSLSKLLIGPFESKKDAGTTLKAVKDNIEEGSFVTKVDS